MTDKNIVRMVDEITRRSKEDTVPAGMDGIYLARVTSVAPLSIQMQNLSISKNLFVNPALLLEASDSGTDIEKPFEEPFEPAAAYEFLKEFHKKYVLKKGDMVVVHVTGSSFYISGKAVPAS